MAGSKGTSGDMTGLTSFDDFWIEYLRAHSLRTTRLLHYVATGVGIASFIAALVVDNWWFFAGGLSAAYSLAWASHFLVQDNVPVAFGGPRAVALSFISDLRMFSLGMTGQLGPELKRAGIKNG